MNPLGIHTQVWSSGWTPEEIERAAEKCVALGYDFLEIPVRAPATINSDATARILMKYGMTCTASFVHTPDTDIASEDGDVAARGELLMREALAVARDIGSRRLVGGMHSSLAKHDRPRSLAGRRNAVGVLRRIAREADTMGMSLCIEALNRYESNFINTAAQILDLIAEIGETNVFAHLDTFHMNIEEADPAEAIRACGRHLGYLHLAENFRGYLGSGSIDFPSIFKAMSAIAYDGPIALEVFSSAVVNPQHSARLAIWREVWSDSEDMARHAMGFITSGLETARRSGVPGSSAAIGAESPPRPQAPKCPSPPGARAVGL